MLLSACAIGHHEPTKRVLQQRFERSENSWGGSIKDSLCVTHARTSSTLFYIFYLPSGQESFTERNQRAVTKTLLHALKQSWKWTSHCLVFGFHGVSRCQDGRVGSCEKKKTTMLESDLGVCDRFSAQVRQDRPWAR